jgi:hypothetical protein
MDELEKFYLPLVDEPVVPSAVDGVYQADRLISERLKKKLIARVSVLENIPDDQKDWHPDSNQQVLDLVHPSLYCYVRGKSRVTNGVKLPWHEFLVAGEPEKKDKEKKSWPNKSARFQWLPSEFKIDDSGNVKIDSYINNLHPFENKKLYRTIASIFKRFIPLFNKTLTEALNPRGNRIFYESVSYDRYSEDIRDPDEYYDNLANRRPIEPVVREFQLASPETKHVVNLNGRTVQVIVKLANIILTPDDPHYNGGVWHVEGMENERIVATGIYYYHTENITESQLGFRVSVTEPMCEQNDDAGVAAIYGLYNDQLLVQPLGSVVTKQDRCIVFPNLYQHKVAPFSLSDPTKPGVRKILCFFLVDPATPVISTARVPPQQISWILKDRTFMEGTYFSLLPNEIIDIIATTYDWSLDSAQRNREKLMVERKFFVDTNKERWERPFSLCEH